MCITQHMGKTTIRFSLRFATQLADHINTSFNHLTYDPQGSQDGDDADVDDDLDEQSELDWKWVNVDFLDGRFSKTQNTVAAVSASLSPGDFGRAGASGSTGTFSYSRSR